jgi:hypothetical protein
MKTKMTPTLYWVPRILGILFAIFISIFALDVFMEGYGFWETVVALVMHLVPTAIIFIVLLIAWRWERLGRLELVNRLYQRAGCPAGSRYQRRGNLGGDLGLHPGIDNQRLFSAA